MKVAVNVTFSDLPGITCQLSQCVDPVNATVLCPATCGKCVELIRSDPELALCMDTDVDCASKKALEWEGEMGEYAKGEFRNKHSAALQPWPQFVL